MAVDNGGSGRDGLMVVILGLIIIIIMKLILKKKIIKSFTGGRHVNTIWTSCYNLS